MVIPILHMDTTLIIFFLFSFPVPPVIFILSLSPLFANILFGKSHVLYTHDTLLLLIVVIRSNGNKFFFICSICDVLFHRKQGDTSSLRERAELALLVKSE